MVNGPTRGSGSRTRGAGWLLAAGMLALTALTAASCSGDDFEKTAEGFNIEPAAEVGPDAFTPSVATEDTENAMGRPPEDGSEIAAAGGGSACDTEKFLKELQARPEAYREWARVLGLSSDDVPAYVRNLKTTVLTSDTKVTNHGLRNGRAYPRQSVLKAGTAVLVEGDTEGPRASTTSSSAPAATSPDGGVIVTRCKCGNPLLPPGDPETTDESTPETDTPGTGTSTPGSIPPGSTAPDATSEGTFPRSRRTSTTISEDTSEEPSTTTSSTKKTTTSLSTTGTVTSQD